VPLVLGCLGRIAAVGDRRSILITGCSSPQGIGFATARSLARDGHSVHATVRNHQHDAELLEGLDEPITVHELDLLDRESMKRTLEELLAAEPTLDVLINNAGYGLIGGIEQVDLDRARANFETNFFGTMALIQEVAPIMRRQHGGHIVNISTIFSAGLCVPGIGYYCATKSALETACQALAIELAPWNVRVTNYEPGPVMTELEREWGNRLVKGEDPRATLSDELYAWVLSDESPSPQSPAEVGEDICRLIESASPGLAEQSGVASREYVAAALRDPTRVAELTPLLEAFARTRTNAAEASPGSVS
jgi:NAD(P)-dependent dehydrogenase (short-subunit alcohol dehydrogenase family)